MNSNDTKDTQYQNIGYVTYHKLVTHLCYYMDNKTHGT